MQKKIIALAVAGLSTAAFAQTNVTIYGVADVSGQGTNVGQHVAPNNNINGSVFTLKSNSSLIGFKGTEDLGNGVSALFQMENQVNLTGSNSANTAGAPQANSANNMFGAMRDSYVGVSSKYGTAMGGYLSTPYRAALNSFDVMPGATGDGRIENLMGTMQYTNGKVGDAVTTAAAGSVLKSSIRATALAYALPTMYGFNGSIAYTGSTNDLNNTNYSNSTSNVLNLRSGLSMNLGWTGYGVNLQGAFQQFGYDQNNNAGSNQLVQGYTSYLLGASYTGVPGLKVAGVYGRNTLGTNGNSTVGAQKGTNNQVWVGASYRFGNNEPRLAYATTSNVSGLNDPTVGSNAVYASQTGATQWTANWGYYLSKRTQVYGIVSGIKNNANGTSNMASGGTNIVLTGGQNVVTYGAGLRTNF